MENFVHNHIKETTLKNMVVWEIWAFECTLVWPSHVPMSNFQASFLKIAKNTYVPIFPWGGSIIVSSTGTIKWVTAQGLMYITWVFLAFTKRPKLWNCLAYASTVSDSCAATTAVTGSSRLKSMTMSSANYWCVSPMAHGGVQSTVH